MDIISYALSKKGMQQSVSDYLDEHLTNPTNPPLDTSLTIANAAADSKATGDKLSELKEGLSQVSESTGNLVSLLSTPVTLLGVTFTPDSHGNLKVTGTATSSGGRAWHLTQNILLTAGTYVVKRTATTGLAVYIQTVSDNTMLGSIPENGSGATLTVTEDTAVYIGANVTDGTTYDTSFAMMIKRGSDTTERIYPPLTAFDAVSRDEVGILATRVGIFNDLYQSGFANLKNLFPFIVAGFNNSGDVSTAIRYRLTSENEYVSNAPLYVYMPNGYRYGIMTYVGDTKIASGWLTGEYVIPKNTRFRLQLAHAYPEDTTAITDVESSDLFTNLVFRGTEETNTHDVIPLSISKMVVQNPWSQGACLVGRKVVGFNASSDDHSTNGTARIYDADNNLTQIGSFGHNTGHASTADYCQNTDTMSVANGTYVSGVVPTIYLVKNASAKIATASNILITDLDVIALDVTNLAGQGAGACFGETDQFMYVLTVESATQYDTHPTKYIYKLLLGKGSNDMTSLFASDNFGTFISGCGDNEYNGTAHLVESYSLTVYGELQGLKYRNGYLFMSCDSSKLTNIKTPYLAKIKLTDGKAELKKYYHIPAYDNTGNLLSVEAEGFVLDGVDGYVSVYGGGSSGVYKFNAIM